MNSEETTLICRICHKEYTGRYKHHLARVSHAYCTKPYNCDTCGNSFEYENTFDNHQCQQIGNGTDNDCNHVEYDSTRCNDTSDDYTGNDFSAEYDSTKVKDTIDDVEMDEDTDCESPLYDNKPKHEYMNDDLNKNLAMDLDNGHIGQSFDASHCEINLLNHKTLNVSVVQGYDCILSSKAHGINDNLIYMKEQLKENESAGEIDKRNYIIIKQELEEESGTSQCENTLGDSKKLDIADDKDYNCMDSILNSKPPKADDTQKHFDVQLKEKDGLMDQLKEMQIKCAVCNYSCNRESDFVHHSKSHSKSQTQNPKTTEYKCDECDFTTNRKGNLVQHSRTHRVEKPFKCELCEYASNHRSHLVRHMRRHTGDKPYKCDTCGQSFVAKDYLDRHMWKHTGSKPHACEFCNLAFSRKSGLVQHMRTHTGERPFKCEFCPSAFIRKNGLLSHLRSSHTGEKPYVCEICNFATSERSVLVTHIRKHTGERPYACKLCSYACKTSSDLVKHNRVHTGEKPFKCEFCGLEFSLKGNLRKHVQKQHMP